MRGVGFKSSKIFVWGLGLSKKKFFQKFIVFPPFQSLLFAPMPLPPTYAARNKERNCSKYFEQLLQSPAGATCSSGSAAAADTNTLTLRCRVCGWVCSGHQRATAVSAHLLMRYHMEMLHAKVCSFSQINIIGGRGLIVRRKIFTIFKQNFGR